MNAELTLRVAREALILVLLISGGPMLASMLVGFVVGMFQATTQIQEQTLSYVPEARGRVSQPAGARSVDADAGGAVRARAFSRASPRSTEAEPWTSSTHCSGSCRSSAITGNVSDFLVVFGLALGRVGSAVSLAPFLGGQAVSRNIKIGLSVVITALLMPALARGQTTPAGPLLVVALLVKEVMIGVTIGFVAQLMLYAVQTAGALIDVQRGMDQPGLHVPQLAGNVSAMGVMFSFNWRW